MQKVLFLCDRRACERCHPECKHTLDISHAKNFEIENGNYVEKVDPLTVFKVDCLLPKAALYKIREELEKQAASGIIVCDDSFEVLRVKDDASVYALHVIKEKADD